MFQRAQYAGYEFRTVSRCAGVQFDNSYVRQDYHQELPAGGGLELSSLFGSIKSIFKHSFWPDGPSKVFLNCEWYDTVGRCPVAGNNVVRKNLDNDWNRFSSIVPLDTCYQIPVALWPYDPMNKLEVDHAMKDCFDVIDRNQDQEV